jgi:sortase A
MSSQHSKTQRRMERVLLGAGLALVLVYLSARVHAVVMYHAGMWSFAALQSNSPAVRGEGEQRSVGAVDFSLWSGGRVKAYVEGLAGKLGTPLAVLSIPKLGLDVPVFEGTGELTLNRGAGRIVGTARPGEQGNMGIAGHRDGFFRGLKDVQVGDRIELAVLGRRFVYAVDSITVVKPSDVGVLQARPRPSLTLVTCYPFYFVGDAPQRYIVRASLADSEQTKVAKLNPEFQKLNKEKTQ